MFLFLKLQKLEDTLAVCQQMNPLPELLHPDQCFSHSYSSRVHSETVCGLEHSMSSLSGRDSSKLSCGHLVFENHCCVKSSCSSQKLDLSNQSCNLFKRLSIFLYSFPLFEGKVKFFYLFFLSYFMAHCILCSMHMISFSLKWKKVFQSYFPDIPHLPVSHDAVLSSSSAGPFLCSYLLYFYLCMRSTEGTIAEKNDWEQTYQVAVNYHQISFPGVFIIFVQEAVAWEDFAQTLQSVSTYTVLVTS